MKLVGESRDSVVDVAVRGGLVDVDFDGHEVWAARHELEKLLAPSFVSVHEKVPDSQSALNLFIADFHKNRAGFYIRDFVKKMNLRFVSDEVFFWVVAVWVYIAERLVVFIYRAEVVGGESLANRVQNDFLFFEEALLVEEDVLLLLEVLEVEVGGVELFEVGAAGEELVGGDLSGFVGFGESLK